jgi:hypothetical protein
MSLVCSQVKVLLIEFQGDDMPRLFHHMGPRYSGNFQAPSLIRYLTYEASTSLNIYLSSIIGPHSRSPVTPGGRGLPSELSPLMRAIKNGVGFTEDAILFSLRPAGVDNKPKDSELFNPSRVVYNAAGMSYGIHKAEMKRDVFVAKPQCLDVALWQIGGPAVTLRLVEMAEVGIISKLCCLLK